MSKQTVIITHEQIATAFSDLGLSYPSPMTVDVELTSIDYLDQESTGVEIECTNPAPTQFLKPDLRGAFETLVGTAIHTGDSDLEALEWSVEEDSGGGYAEVAGSPFDDDLQHVYTGTAGYSYKVRCRGRDVYDQVGTWSVYSDVVELSAIGLDDLTDDVWQLVATDYDGNTPTALEVLYDNITAAGGIIYAVAGTDKWIEYSYPVQHVMSQVMLWVNAACNCYFAVSEDGTTWEWLAAEADHTGAGANDDILVAVANQAAAQADFMTTGGGKHRYVFPTQKFLKKCRVYLMTSVTVREILWWKLVAGDEIRGGILASLNIGAAAGSIFYLDDGVFKLGGTAAPKLSWDGANLAVEGTITITGGSGIAALTDAGALATGDDLGDVPDGGGYGRVLSTHLSAGKIKLTSAAVKDAEWYDESGVEIDATHGINIYGVGSAFTTRATKAGTIECYVGADGHLYAGAGVVELSASGIRIDLGTGVPNKIEWMDGATPAVYVYGFESGGVLYYGYLRADRGTKSGMVYVSARTTGGVAYMGGENAAGTMVEMVCNGVSNQMIFNAQAGGLIVFRYAGVPKLTIRSAEPVVIVEGYLGFDGGTSVYLRRNGTHIEWYDGGAWVQLDNGP